MKKVNFNQISSEFPIENKDNFFWTIIGATSLTIIFILIQQKFQLSKVALIPIILFGVFLLIISRRLLSDWTNEKDIIGEIEFKEEYLIIAESENRLNYKEIECIYFRYNFIKGRSFAPKDYIHNGLTELNLTTKVGEVKKIKFIIETNEQFEYLKTIFKKWYQQGIEINEEFMNQKLKTICLEVVGNKSYKEIQELKNKIKNEARR